MPTWFSVSILFDVTVWSRESGHLNNNHFVLLCLGQLASRPSKNCLASLRSGCAGRCFCAEDLRTLAFIPPNQLLCLWVLWLVNNIYSLWLVNNIYSLWLVNNIHSNSGSLHSYPASVSVSGCVHVCCVCVHVCVGVCARTCVHCTCVVCVHVRVCIARVVCVLLCVCTSVVTITVDRGNLPIVCAHCSDFMTNQHNQTVMPTAGRQVNINSLKP